MPPEVRHSGGNPILTDPDTVTASEYVMSAFKVKVPEAFVFAETLPVGQSWLIAPFSCAWLTQELVILQFPTTSPPQGWTLPQLPPPPQLEKMESERPTTNRLAPRKFFIRR